MNQIKDITCVECGRSLSLEEALRERQIEGFVHAREVGLLCPHCEAWTHSYFMNHRLDRLLATVKKRKAAIRVLENGELGGSAMAVKRYKKAHGRYKKEFDRFNAWLRGQFDVKGSAEPDE